MHKEQTCQDEPPVAGPPEPKVYIVGECCGMMIFSNEPPEAKPQQPSQAEEFYPY